MAEWPSHSVFFEEYSPAGNFDTIGKGGEELMMEIRGEVNRWFEQMKRQIDQTGEDWFRWETTRCFV